MQNALRANEWLHHGVECSTWLVVLDVRGGPVTGTDSQLALSIQLEFQNIAPGILSCNPHVELGLRPSLSGPVVQCVPCSVFLDMRAPSRNPQADQVFDRESITMTASVLGEHRAVPGGSLNQIRRYTSSEIKNIPFRSHQSAMRSISAWLYMAPVGLPGLEKTNALVRSLLYRSSSSLDGSVKLFSMEVGIGRIAAPATVAKPL